MVSGATRPVGLTGATDYDGRSCDFGICLCPRSHLHHPSTGQILILYHFLPHQKGKIDVLHAQDDMATQLAVPQLENSMRNHSAKN